MEDFTKLMENRYQDRIRELRSQVYDTNFELMDMVDIEVKRVHKRNEELLRTVVTEEQKQALQEQELSQEILDSLKQFQSAVNVVYERTARDNFVASFEHYANILRKPILRLKRVAASLLNI